MKPATIAILQRMLASVELLDKKQKITGDWNVLFSGHRGKDDPDDWWERDTDAGAACFGDSGGPVLADTRDGEVIVAVISFLLKENCKRPRSATASTRVRAGFIAASSRAPSLFGRRVGFPAAPALHRAGPLPPPSSSDDIGQNAKTGRNCNKSATSRPQPSERTAAGASGQYASAPRPVAAAWRCSSAR